MTKFLTVQAAAAPAPQTRPTTPTGPDEPIAYHTTDDVNRSVMTRLAGLFRIPVDHREPRDRAADASVLLFDADYWWADPAERGRGLNQLVTTAAGGRVVAVHGWTLDDDQLDALQGAGVLAQVRLNLAMVARIARVMRGG